MHSKLPQLTIFLALALGLISSVFLGNAIGSSNIRIIAEIAAVALGITWVVLGGHYWWLPLAFGLGIGGFFTIPYKIYPHELALCLSLAALFPRLVLVRSSFRSKRPKLPLIFYTLALYLTVHFGMSLVAAEREGAGNIARAYMNALWPLIFGYYFWRFGSTQILRAGLRTVYVAVLIRMVFGLVNYYADRTYVVPGINYSIDPQDLRASGSLMFVMSLLFTLMRGGALSRLLNAVMLMISVWVILLGGSRGGFAMMLFVPLFLFAIYRRWIPLITAGACTGLLILWVNVYPRVLETLPQRAARAASVLLAKERLDVQQTARESNDWHRVILPGEAVKRWSRNARTVAFGTGIQPYRSIRGNMYQGQIALYRMAEVAADMGAYESAFWTLLAVLGITGVVLYVLLMLWFGRRLFAALRLRKARDPTWAVMFWACLAIAQWFVFALTAGSYPSWEIFLAFLALAAVSDERPKVRPVEPARPSPRLEPQDRLAPA